MSILSTNLIQRMGVITVGAILATVLMMPSAAADGPGGQTSITNKYDSSTRTVTVTGSGLTPGSSGVQSKPKTSTKTSKSSAPPLPENTVPCRNETQNSSADNYFCFKQPTKKTPSKPAPNIPEIGMGAAASITLPINAPVFGPTPSQNKWNTIPVGYPLWLWTSDTQTTISQTVVNQGFSVSVTATRQNITYNMGDGHQVTCTSFTPRPTHNDPFQPSPTCGYTYTATGQYTITATTTWAVTWQVAGQSGSLPLTDTASAGAPLPVSELHTVIVSDPPR